MFNYRQIALVILGFMTGLMPLVASGERIKDLASIRGVRSNQLIGYGVVWGWWWLARR